MKKNLLLLICVFLLALGGSGCFSDSESQDPKPESSSAVTYSSEEYLKMVNKQIKDYTLVYEGGMTTAYNRTFYFVDFDNKVITEYNRKLDRSSGKLKEFKINTYSIIGDKDSGWSYSPYTSVDVTKFYRFFHEGDVDHYKENEIGLFDSTGKLIESYDAKENLVNFKNSLVEALNTVGAKKAYEMLTPQE